MLTKLQKAALASSMVALVATPAFAQLAPDSEHDVVVLQDCDTAVRYNKKSFVPVKAELRSSDYFLKEVPVKSLMLSESYPTGVPERLYIECYDTGKVGAFGGGRFSKDFLAANKVKEVTFPNARVSKETGFEGFGTIESVKIFEVTPKGGESSFFLYGFQHGKNLTIFARKMRPGTKGFDNDPVAIVTKLQLAPTAGCTASVEVAPPAVVQSQSQSGPAKEASAK